MYRLVRSTTNMGTRQLERIRFPPHCLKRRFLHCCYEYHVSLNHNDTVDTHPPHSFQMHLTVDTEITFNRKLGEHYSTSSYREEYNDCLLDEGYFFYSDEKTTGSIGPVSTSLLFIKYDEANAIR